MGVKSSDSRMSVLLYRFKHSFTHQNVQFPAQLKILLESPVLLKCGIGLHGLKNDLHSLYEQFGINMRNSADLLPIAKKGLKKAISEEFGDKQFQAPKYKKFCMSNWEQSKLKSGQIMY